MTLAPEAHDAYVGARFDALQGRFKSRIDSDDFRLRAILRAIEPPAGLRVLDLGCGKGRFASRLREHGAEVIGMDRSRAMLEHDPSGQCVQATARRMPFADSRFDAVVALEVFQHLSDHDAVLREILRVLRPGGTLAIIDKNLHALDARRPWLPSAFLKWVDVRRGRWMYPANAPVRERWRMPHRFARHLMHGFESVRVEYLLSPDEQRYALFRRIPQFRLFTLWQARRPGIGDG